MANNVKNEEANLNFYLSPEDGGSKVHYPDTKNSSPVRYDNHTVEIHDVRGREAEFSLDKNGFAFAPAPTTFNNFADEREIKSKYYPEIEKLILAITGANQAHALNHVKRMTLDNDTPSLEVTHKTDPTKKVFPSAPATFIHVDYSYQGAWDRFDGPHNRNLNMSDFPEWDRLKKTHWACYSVWKPLQRVTRDALMAGDKTTVPDEDLREVLNIFPDGREYNLFQVAYKPTHKFYYQSAMDVDECLILKLFDSKTDGRARCTPHGAFQGKGDHGQHRQSIETRFLVFWTEESLE